MGEPEAQPEVRPRDDAAVLRRIFLAIAGIVGAIAVIYWFTSYEDAGSVLLVLSAVLALWYAVFLWLQRRQGRVPAADIPPETAGPLAETGYLPHASIWPLAIGFGTALILNGLVLGIWVITPGIALLLAGTAGFIRQSRRRD